MLVTPPRRIIQDSTHQTAKTLSEVHKLIKESKVASSQALVAFDIDRTLVVIKHPAAYYPNLQQHLVVWRQLFERLSEEEQEQVFTWVVHHNEQELIESQTPAIIQDLQDQGFKTIGFTALLRGPFIDGETLENRRFQSLQRLGIDFRQAFSEKICELADIAKYNNQYPVYHQGILYSNGERGEHNKGTVLVSFLNKIGFKPKVIVMVDDKPFNLTDIKEALAKFDSTIEFIGIEYVGGKSYSPEQVKEADFIAFWQGHIDRIKQESALAKEQK